MYAAQERYRVQRQAFDAVHDPIPLENWVDSLNYTPIPNVNSLASKTDG